MYRRLAGASVRKHFRGIIYKAFPSLPGRTHLSLCSGNDYQHPLPPLLFSYLQVPSR